MRTHIISQYANTHSLMKFNDQNNQQVAMQEMVLFYTELDAFELKPKSASQVHEVSRIFNASVDLLLCCQMAITRHYRHLLLRSVNRWHSLHSKYFEKKKSPAHLTLSARSPEPDPCLIGKRTESGCMDSIPAMYTLNNILFSCEHGSSVNIKQLAAYQREIPWRCSTQIDVNQWTLMTLNIYLLSIQIGLESRSTWQLLISPVCL